MCGRYKSKTYGGTIIKYRELSANENKIYVRGMRLPSLTPAPSTSPPTRSRPSCGVARGASRLRRSMRRADQDCDRACMGMGRQKCQGLPKTCRIAEVSARSSIDTGRKILIAASEVEFEEDRTRILPAAVEESSASAWPAQRIFMKKRP